MLLFGVPDGFLEVLFRNNHLGLFFFRRLLFGFVENFGLRGSLALGVGLLDCPLDWVFDLAPHPLEVLHVLFVIEVVFGLHNEFQEYL